MSLSEPAPAQTLSALASAAGASSAAAPSASPTVAVSFADNAGTIDAPSIAALAQLGVLDTTSGAFRPDHPVDRIPAFEDLPATDPDFPFVQGHERHGQFGRLSRWDVPATSR